MPVDPLTVDPAVLEQREDEEAREQRWMEFVTFLRQHYDMPRLHRLDVEAMIDDLRSVAIEDTWNEGSIEFEGFVESDGWAGLFAAIARALKEQEQGR